jgi:hypothetical protein
LAAALIVILFALRHQPLSIIFGYGVISVAWLIMLTFLVSEPMKEEPVVDTAMPDVVLLSTPGRLKLHNRGARQIQIWGTNLNGATNIEAVPRNIPVGLHYYILTEEFESRMRGHFGASGDALLPFETFLSVGGRRYIGKFMLRVAVRGENVTVHTQQLGIEEGDWIAPQNAA